MSTTRLVAVAILLSLAAPIWADEAADEFSKLYGEDLKRVAATPSSADDIALAKQLLEDARKIEKQLALLAVLCENAYELAVRDTSGYPTATAALYLLAEKVPEKKTDCLQKAAALYQKQYAAARGDAKTKAGEKVIAALSTVAEAEAAAGDADAAATSLRQAIAIATAIKPENKALLQRQLDNLAPQQKVEKQMAALKAKLDADPKDDASRKELVRLWLVEMDNPAGAAKFLDESLDETTRKYVPAATKPLEEAPELACKELGEWYKRLADQASAPAGKGAMLRRAQGYYERFLDLHKTEDLARGAATLALKKIEDAQAKLGSAGEGKTGQTPEAQPETTAKFLLGTWEQVPAKPADPGKPNQDRLLKMITPSHWLILSIDVWTHKLRVARGGPCWFGVGEYSEAGGYETGGWNLSPAEVWTFKIRKDGDRFIQFSGKTGNYGDTWKPAAPATGPAAVPGSPPPRGQPETTAKFLLGTWELVPAKPADPGNPNQERRLKMITPSHFVVLSIDTRTHKVKGAHGGPCSFGVDEYSEIIEYATAGGSPDPAKKHTFKIRKDGDRHIQSAGTFRDNYDETWKPAGPVSKPAAAPGSPAAGR